MASKLNYKKYKIINAAIILLAAFFIAPKIVSAEIIFNEVMYSLPGADDKHEWVEIYNNGASSVDLTNWKLNDGDTATNHGLNAPPKNSSRGSIVLEAGGYALLADDAATLIADLPNYTGTIIDTVLSLVNTSANLKLLNSDGVEVASASYNKELGGDGNGRSLEWDGAALKESLVDGGTPGRVNSVLGSPVSPSPSAAPSVSPAATASPIVAPPPSSSSAAPNYQYSQKVFINEFLPWPAEDDKEWVELINLDEATVNLTGWQIDDADNSTAPQAVPANTIISAQGFLVISFNRNTLNNDGDKVRLLWPDDQIVHSVSYGKAIQNQTVAKFDTGWLWTSQPTPGQTNKKSLTNIQESAPTVQAANSEQITAKEENVNSPAPATKRAATALPSPATTLLPNDSSQNAGLPQPNLLAAAANEPIKSAKNNSTLFLAGVLFLAALTAIGLIYFRRQKQVDIESMDD